MPLVLASLRRDNNLTRLQTATCFELQWKAPRNPAKRPFLLERQDEPLLISVSPIMHIGILSDTHDQVQRTRAAVAMLIDKGAEILIHCGDLTTADVVRECSSIPCFFVFGNCDYDREGLRQAITLGGGTCLERGGLITVEGRRLAVTHGDSEPGSSTPDGTLSPTICSPAILMLLPIFRKARRGGSILEQFIEPRSGQWHCSILQAVMSVCCQLSTQRCKVDEIAEIGWPLPLDQATIPGASLSRPSSTIARSSIDLRVRVFLTYTVAPRSEE